MVAAQKKMVAVQKKMVAVQKKMVAVQKKMVAVNFTTIPCKPNRFISIHRKPYFCEIHPCTIKIVNARCEVFRPFLCVFMSGFRIFVR